MVLLFTDFSSQSMLSEEPEVTGAEESWQHHAAPGLGPGKWVTILDTGDLFLL